MTTGPGPGPASFDVIVDLGRLSPDSAGPEALTDRVDAVVVVVRGDAASVMHAADRAPGFMARWGGVAGLVVIGSDRYSVSEIEKVVGIPALAELPFDAKAAAVATGSQPGDRRLLRSPLTLAAARLAGRLSVDGPSAREETTHPSRDRWAGGLRPLLATVARLGRRRVENELSPVAAPSVPEQAPDQAPPSGPADAGRPLVDSMQREVDR